MSVPSRPVSVGDLDPAVRPLLRRHDSMPDGALRGLPLLAVTPAGSWRADWADGVYELHLLDRSRSSHGPVFRDPDLDLVQRVLVASLVRSWSLTRPWRWPSLWFDAATATLEEWDRLRSASLEQVVAATDTIDGAGILTPRGSPIPEDLVTEAVHARTVGRALRPRGSWTDPATVFFGDGGSRNHFRVTRRTDPPRYELAEMPERSNAETVRLRTDDPAHLEAELLRRF